ncbi:MAG: hypothetical protein HOP14_10520 [Acidobacteria bacterium]|nr:hypothetical protein [Acidobacteriota bacterium]
MYLTPGNLPAMRVKLGGPFRTEFARFVQLMDEAAPTVVTDAVGWRNEDNFMYIADYAFLYQVDPSTVPGISPGLSRAQYGDLAIQLLLQAIANGVEGHFIPVAYDWLHDRLTVEQRRQVVTHMLGFREPKSTDSPFDDQPMYGRERWVTSGLAFYGEYTGIGDLNTGNIEALRRMDDYSRFIEGESTSIVTAGNFVAGSDGGWSQGLGYSTRDSTLAAIRAMEARRTAFGLTREDVFGPATVFRRYPQWIVSMLLPQGGGALWRTHNTDEAPKYAQYTGMIHLLGALRLYKGIDDNTAGLAQWLLDTQGTLSQSSTSARLFYLFGHFLLAEGVTARSPVEAGMPLTKRFETYGSVFMRTRWTPEWVDAGDSFVALDAATWARPNTYWQVSNPSFTIDRRGPLVIKSGTAGHQVYAAGAWSGNTIIFPDPDEVLDQNSWDRGGQRKAYINVTGTDFLQPASDYDVGGITRASTFEPGNNARDFDYFLADATRTFNGPYAIDAVNSSKVARFTRQFVYFRPESAGQPDRIVIFDRTETTGEQFEKRWIFHPSRRPVIGGAPQANVPIRNGSGEGKTTYTGNGNGTMSVVNDADGSNGQLWVTSLLPVDRNVVLVGGPNSFGEWAKPTGDTDPTPFSHEFEDPFGFPNPNRNSYKLSDAQYVGQYRVEIIPAVSTRNADFLNVFEAGEVGTPKSPTAYLSGQNYRGVRVGNRIAVFATLAAVEYNGDQERGVAQGDFTIDQAGAYRVLVADLGPGVEYEVTTGSSTARQAATSSGLLYMSVNASAGTRVSFRALQPIPELPPPPVAPAAPSTSAPAAPRNLRILAQ